MSSRKNYWHKLENQRNFLEEVAKKFGINKPQDWTNVTTRQLVKQGGSQLLRIYGGSVGEALKILYPDVPWKIEWFSSKRFWQNSDNQKRFLERIAKKFNVINTKDWKKVNWKQIKEKGALLALTRQFGSFSRAVEYFFPNNDWSKELFTHASGFWNKKENQLKFLNLFAKQNKIENPMDWGRMRAKDIVEYGGSALMVMYGGSLFTVLQNVYSDIKWKREWFPSIPKYGKNHWNSLENQREFLFNISEQYHLINPTQWKRVSLRLILKKGGKGLLNKYSGSLEAALRTAFPQIDWSQLVSVKSIMQASKPQKSLENFASYWFPDQIIYVNYRHPGFLFYSLMKLKKELIYLESMQSIELDLWIPGLNLAFEYHGEQHYKYALNSPLELQKKRDLYRRNQCKAMGISLIEIPYWWNQKEETLLATVLQARPDLLHLIRSDLIPMFKKQQSGISTIDNNTYSPVPRSYAYKDSEFLMLSCNWTPKSDPTGWYLSEKYDGQRGYWNGENMLSKLGNVIEIPDKIKKMLPKDMHLDGEIWAGKHSFNKCRQCIANKDWSSLRFQVFDAPNIPQPYLQRQQILRNTLKETEHVTLVPIRICEGMNHLLFTLEETLRNGGEGIILRNPNSLYVKGRSFESLKVKPYYTEKVVVREVEKVTNTHQGIYKFMHLKVENKSGMIFSLNTKTSSIRFPDITKDSIVTITFCGLNANGSPKFSTILEHHSHSQWDKILSYSLEEGSSTYRTATCEGCYKSFLSNETRIQVKGACWANDSLFREPSYRIFSFCPTTRCLDQGIASMSKRGDLFPSFEGKIALKTCKIFPQIGDIQLIPLNNGFMSEDFYIFKS